MSIGRIAAAALLALAAPLALGAAQPAAQAQADWTTRVERTAEGGFRMGNPDARLKLVEFVSLTCSHCGDFATQAVPGLHARVRTGELSVEYRNFVLNYYDVAAAVLSRCAAPANYFPFTNQLLVEQRSWIQRIEQLTPAQRSEVERQPSPATMRRIVDLVGLRDVAARHGMASADVDACLANENNLRGVIDMLTAASNLGVSGTPTFMLNGRLLNVSDWAGLQPQLAAAP